MRRLVLGSIAASIHSGDPMRSVCWVRSTSCADASLFAGPSGSALSVEAWRGSGGLTQPRTAA